MMQTRTSQSGLTIPVLVTGLMAIVSSIATAGPTLEIEWSTHDGGGGVLSDGRYTLTGTAGQPDGQSLTDGAISVAGGFWSVPQESDQCLADLAPPFGVLDFDDILAFLTAFSSMDAAADFAPPQGVFDFDDILAFLVSFGDGCP